MRLPLAIASCLALTGLVSVLADVSPAPGATQRQLLHILYDACRIRQRQTGRFPKDLRDVASMLGEELRRQIPARVEFDDPESETNQLSRRSPLGERTPCLRLELDEDHWLNVSCTGWIYESGIYWQSEFVELLPRPFANPALLRHDWRPIPDRAGIRSPRCASNQINLAPYCNAIPTGPWFFGPADDGTGQKIPKGEKTGPGFRDWLAAGIYERGNILFDVRGAIQLDGRLSAKGKGVRWLRSYPTEVNGIVVNQKAGQILLLAGTIFKAAQGAVLATLRVHFASGQIAELPLRYGREVAAAEDVSCVSERLYPTRPIPETAAGSEDVQYSLHQVRLANPRPMDTIATIDFVSGLETSHPYILAMTLEP
jgi:hypothetical protein